jgi:hypothetical protein
MQPIRFSPELRADARLHLIKMIQPKKFERGRKPGTRTEARELERLNVRRLPTLGSLDYVELHCLTFLKALETV